MVFVVASPSFGRLVYGVQLRQAESLARLVRVLLTERDAPEPTVSHKKQLVRAMQSSEAPVRTSICCSRRSRVFNFWRDGKRVRPRTLHPRT